MPYVKKVNGKVVGIFSHARNNAQEFLEDDNPEIVAFRNRGVDAEALEIKRAEAIEELLEASAGAKAQEYKTLKP